MTTIENIHTYLNYNTTLLEKNDLLTITWDCKYDEEKEEFINKELNDLIGNEYRYNPENGKASFMWVEEFKKYFNYDLGKKMYIFIKSNADGYFNAWAKSGQDENNWYDMYIDEEGYINVSNYYYPFNEIEGNGYSRYLVKIYIRPDCIYNDNIYTAIQEQREIKEKEEKIKEKEEKINNCETVLKNLKSGDIITFDTYVYLIDKRFMDKYKVLKICSKTIKCVEMGTIFMGKEILVKKERLLYNFKNYNFTITRE